MLKRTDPLANQLRHLYQQVKALQLLSQQVSVPVTQHQAQQLRAKVHQQVRATLRQLVQAKVHQHLYQQASVLANQHQAQQMLVKVLQQAKAPRLL